MTVASQAAVSVNLALDDPAYPLLEKLVRSGLTSATALTIKPITRLYAARLLAEALEARRRDLDTTASQDPWLDELLEYLSGRLKAELRQLGALYAARRPETFVVAPLVDLKLETIFAKDQFILRDRTGLTQNLQGVFGGREGFAYGNNVTLRTRSVSWLTLFEHYAAYVEPEVLVRSDPLVGDDVKAGLYKAYLKASYENAELAFGRDTLQWGPGSQGDLVLSNNAPPLDMLKLSTPMPFRLPWLARDAGEWQVAYFVARLEAHRDFPHTLLSGLRLTLQPTSYLTFGFSNAMQAFGQGGVHPNAGEFLQRTFVPVLRTSGRQVNSIVAYDAVVSLPFLRVIPFVKGATLYWQRGYDNATTGRGLLGGGNILGGVVEGGRWDVRFEYVDTRDRGAPWYTHPTYNSGFAYRDFGLGHPIGGDAEGFFGRATYYWSPTAWLAADGRQETYGATAPHAQATQRRFGLEGSYQLPWRQRYLTLWSRAEYATLDEPSTTSAQTFNVQLTARWHF